MTHWELHQSFHDDEEDDHWSKCKQDPVVNESSDIKLKMKQWLFLDKQQCQDSNF